MKTMQFHAKFEDVQKINPLFSKCKIYTLYTGINRNNSYLSKQSVENALPTLYNIPIVGEFIEKNDNFGGHGGKIEITDKGIEFIQTTRPFGVVPESAKIYWEDVTEKNGVVNEYLVIEDAYLWTGRYEEVNDLLKNTYGQSMEIEINNGSFADINGKEAFEIKDFIFSALCILGIDKNGEGHVEPCFESSSITAYSFDKEEFKKQFNQMISELKFSINQQSTSKEVDLYNMQEKGGKNVEEILAMLEKYNLTLEDLSAKEINHEDFSIEELEIKIQESFSSTDILLKEQTKTQDNNQNPTDEFALTSNQLEDGLRRELAEIETITEDFWGEVYSYPRYSYRDNVPQNNIVIAMDEKNWYLVGFNFTVSGDNVEINGDSLVRYKVDYIPMDLSNDPDNDDNPTLMSLAKSEFMLNAKEKEMTKQFEAEKNSLIAESTAKFETIQSELNTLKEQYSSLEERANSLDAELVAKVQAEREQAENELFTKFSAQLSEDDMAEIKAKCSEMSLEQIEEKLLITFAKKNVKFSLNKQEDKPVRFNLPTGNEKPKSDKPYASLIERYKK